MMKVVRDMTLPRYPTLTSENRCNIIKRYCKGFYGDFRDRTAVHWPSWQSIVDGPRWMNNDRWNLHTNRYNISLLCNNDSHSWAWVPVETLVGNGLSSPGSLQSWHKLICDNKARESGVSGGGGGGGKKIVSPLFPREGLIHSLAMTEMRDSLPRFKKRLPVGYIPVVVLDYQSTVSCTITRGLQIMPKVQIYNTM